MTDQEVKQLIDKYENGSATPEERAMLESWYIHYSQKNRHLEYSGSLSDKDYLMKKKYNGLKQILALGQLKRQKTVVFRPKIWLQVSAAALVILVSGAWLYKYQQERQIKGAAVTYANDISPGKNTAILTLANGKKILLSDVRNGSFADESGVLIPKTANGQLVYQIRGQEMRLSNCINTLTTGRKEQYQLLLPDGTHVWLNAASSLKFPSTFRGLSTRKVELEGEAYFEVKRNEKQAFIVKSAGQQVEVLGTHFNVNAYKNENLTKTTLLEGSVKINGHAMLKPGQESSLLRSGVIKIKEVDVENAVSWKDGYFKFDKMDLKSIMLTISRWYDVEVIYKEPSLEHLIFSGTVSKEAHISKILEVLELSKEVHFKIEERRILVTK